MITLTPIECAIRRALLTRAQDADPAEPLDACLSYKDLGLLVDPGGEHSGMSRPPFRTMFPALGHVSTYEVEHGRPMLSALVVAEQSGTPGPGFTELARSMQFQVIDDTAFWRLELGEVVQFWTQQDPVMLLDSAIDQVMEEIRAIHSMVRSMAPRDGQDVRGTITGR
ncbi:hypothetical protein [Streptomyces silvisoli]|uniref:Nuclear transport factor 2 family protein n=1 Tax=Streptomyces silvisoli TaxID=3034235 RepID=A0ABT5ZP14_9ACTN|nr:hypothetical protein [Streptomyces silvisoli]MDF3291569.1 hypothetical protein [Streptomyces silvisoli]